MNFQKAEFVVSAYGYRDYPRHSLPEIAFSGKSNVGKSSLINSFLNKKNLAKTSSRPGKTQSVNFFKIDNDLFLVDLPGYGFARVPDQVQEEWGGLMDDYLHNRPQLQAIIQIVDARHPPTDLDIMMIDWLLAVDLPFLVAATKVDKISRSQRKTRRQVITEKLKLPEMVPFTFYSSQTGEGVSQIKKFIYEIINN